MLKKFLTLFEQKSLLFTLISVFLGILIGAVILLAAGYNPFRAYGIILQGIFGKPKYLSYVIIRSTPLILTGLSIAFAFRTGLFNIGAEGQYIIGSLTAVAVGYFIHLPAVFHITLVLLSALIAAGFWGGIAGFFKAKFGVNEVISTIMLNWIAFYLLNFFVYLPGFQKPYSEVSYNIQTTASIRILDNWKHTEAGRNWLQAHPFWNDLFRTPVNWGILIAIIIAILIWYILKHTTLGYRLKAVGFNAKAAEYGGIDVKKNTVISMTIAGAISGLAGAVQVMGVSHNVSLLATMEGYGFDGIAVALIGNSNPIGCIFSGLLFGGLKYGGQKIQPMMGAPSEIVNIVIGVIVFFVAIPQLIKLILKFFRRKGKRNV
ncbi:MAG: ABC transporter permease [Candidatus Cloacimonetes bacterium]|nr:ABC transporter permease [Candidatus Cloacimonadota bacterium]MCF7815090.1 ABC transporter permease [Candidatus Cloacimonadota bacterium]MCF7869314.1 ABC transporter permease [Candidatus Cloacimonadota bacterium]MCF7884734.1 ABC transporter permease [Candidatus Cloacimonadota bacterium]